MKKALIFIASIVAITGCIFATSDTPAKSSGKTGNASLQIAVTASGPFATLADSIVLTISASDMPTITKQLTLTGDAITGLIEGIPAGANRLFEVKVFDSTGTLQYQGSTTATVTAGGNVSVSISIVRIVGSANINGQVIELPTVGWTVFDGFEGATLDAKWKPYSGTVGGLTTTQKHSGLKALQVTFSDYKYTFSKPITNGQISWWYYDQGGTYLYILTDTSKSDLTVDNLHMTTVQPAGLASNRYNFYYKVGGYQQAITRSSGWKHMVVTIGGGQIKWELDGVTGITISQPLPVIGFQVAGAIIDDFYAVSNTD